MIRTASARDPASAAAATAGPGRAPAGLADLQSRADGSAKVAQLSALQRAALQRQKDHNSVKFSGIQSAISIHHPDWQKGSAERTMTVWQIAEDPTWDFHFTAICPGAGFDCTKFHFTIRRKTGQKGDDGFAWFEFQGNNAKATIGGRANNGKAAYWDTGTAEFQSVSQNIRALFAQIDGWAAAIAATAARKSG